MTAQQELKLLQPHDYDELYREGKTSPGEIGTSLDVIPWDIQAPQPGVLQIESAGEITGRVLDAGCGLGENALFFAQRGYRVTGVDVSARAVERARSTASDRGLDVEFLVADATTMDGVRGPFDTIVDSALLHCLYAEAQRRYVAALRTVSEPGTRLHLLCFSDELPEEIPAYRSSEDHLRELFGDGWTILRLTRRGYATTFTKDKVRSLVERDSSAMDLSRLEVDDAGRLLLPSWQLTAERI